MQAADVIEGFAYRSDARMLGWHLNVEHQRLLERPVEQLEQLALQRVTLHPQDQVAAILVDADQAALRRRGNGQAALLHRHAALAQGDCARTLQGDADQVIAFDVAGVDFHLRTVMQVEQRGTAKKHPIKRGIERIALLQAHAMRP
ncbi:hypothetical protein D3C76_1187650 [compost metagenome]